MAIKVRASRVSWDTLTHGRRLTESVITLVDISTTWKIVRLRAKESESGDRLRTSNEPRVDKLRLPYYTAGMPRFKAKTAAQMLEDAYTEQETWEWYVVSIIAEDGSSLVDMKALWKPAQAAAFKELSVGASFTVCHVVKTCEPL